MNSSSKTLALVEGAIMVALATALSFVKFFQFPWGGSITLVSMLPICLYSIKRGSKNGMFASIVYALIQLGFGIALDGLLGWGLTGVGLAASIAFDYVVAFSVLGLTGLLNTVFKKVVSSKALGCCMAVLLVAAATTSVLLFNKAFADKPVAVIIVTALAVIFTVLIILLYVKEKDLTKKASLIAIGLVCVLRFLSHFLAGVIAYASWAFELWPGFPADNVPLYSLAYNGAYMLPELVLVLVGAVLLLRIPTFRRFLYVED